ncbi:MAG: LysM peptidoglycan-binding domain-containing protein [Leptolyngbyaceae cyanobacterium CSU_1_4]|nr:LysM peptidoglycan-binding domain-containing protein [Leptolyngbyaceae cyanobacterium CSU_1_4]
MARKHGQTNYFIEGEGFVGEQEIRQGVQPFARALLQDVQPNTELDAERAFRFSRMFADLPKFRPDPEALVELGKTMDDTPNFKDHQSLPAGFTYLGQFIDHDITFDKTEGLPTSELEPEEIIQGRSPSLDLDSVYGRGPDLETKPLYESDRLHLRTGITTELPFDPNEPEAFKLPNDLPRGDNAERALDATLGDPRNDENLAVAQTHLAFLKFHNVVVNQLQQFGHSGSDLFDRAREIVTLHYQWIILNDFLPRIVLPAILKKVLVNGGQFFKPTPGEEAPMPIEFSVAAYRFGHSMIRDVYSWNRNFADATLGQLFIFSGVSGDMVGLPTLPSNWPIDWRRFYDFKDAPGVEPPPALNLTRSIDTGLAMTLRELPEFVGQGNNAALAVRNLLRGRLLGLPTGQAIAEAIGVTMLTPEQVRQGPHANVLKKHKFDTQTPLWYYILKEAEVFNEGQRLGPVGSQLVVETFVGLIQGSQTSLLSNANQYWRPSLPSLRPGQFTMVDLLLLVNDLNPLGDERIPTPPPPPPPLTHVVQPGETLGTIAAKFLGDSKRWREIFEANRDKITEPNLIRPGMELIIPNH